MFTVEETRALRRYVETSPGRDKSADVGAVEGEQLAKVAHGCAIWEAGQGILPMEHFSLLDEVGCCRMVLNYYDWQNPNGPLWN